MNSASPPPLGLPAPGAPAASAASAAAMPAPGDAPDKALRAIAIPPGLVLAWLLAALALSLGLLLWQKVNGMQQQLARQSADASARAAEAGALARQASELVHDAAGKLAALETRVADMADYRSELEELVRRVARARDDNLPAELESNLRMAQEQAHLTGSVQPLLAALRMAEQRLARAGDPRLSPVRRAAAADLERMRAAAVIDTAGLLTRIDQLLRQVDGLPALIEVERSALARAPATPAPVQAAEHAPPEAAQAPAFWSRLWHAVLDDAHGLIRVARIDRPEASMASPEQIRFVREHLKLRLQSARLALLARQYEAARADLAAANALISQWFDSAARSTQAAATLLQQLQGQIRTAELPRPDATLAALAHSDAQISQTDPSADPSAADPSADASADPPADPPANRQP